MKDWFKDNLYWAEKIVGSYDDRKEQYNMSILTMDDNQSPYAKTLSYVEEKRGWESFKSYIHEDGISHKNTYYTFPSNLYSRSNATDPYGVNYYTSPHNFAEMFQHNIDFRIKRAIKPSATRYDNVATIQIGGGTIKPLIGMNVVGNGVPEDTYITSVSCDMAPCTISLNNLVFLDEDEELEFTMPRNRFYDIPHYSMLKTVFNRDQGSVKRFKTVNYEGSQAKIIPNGGSTYVTNTHDLYDYTGALVNTGIIIEDNYDKLGWFVERLETDMQVGSVREFVNKENKWFDYIRGKDNTGLGNLIDTGEFSLQGLGWGTLIGDEDE
ncbi:MAG: hypothetical protein CMI60_02850 [Parvibaculum sp.]|nr:hypothetical protein [Parvibaculum sp.]